MPPNIAMTGEITLRGRVGAVGGIKEKVLGAHRANVTKVILPWANRKDVEHDVPAEVRSVMEFTFVRTVEEALEWMLERTECMMHDLMIRHGKPDPGDGCVVM